MALTPDRQKQVETAKQRYGEDFYKRIGSRGGKKTPTKFNSESGRKAVEARWAKYREAQAKKREKGEK